MSRVQVLSSMQEILDDVLGTFEDDADPTNYFGNTPKAATVLIPYHFASEIVGIGKDYSWIPMLDFEWEDD